jgi:hypothetical protein
MCLRLDVCRIARGKAVWRLKKKDFSGQDSLCLEAEGG